MKRLATVVIAGLLIGAASAGYAQSSGPGGAAGSEEGMTSGRASAQDNNNNPGTTAGTPTHSVPQKSSGFDDSGARSSGK